MLMELHDHISLQYQQVVENYFKSHHKINPQDGYKLTWAVTEHAITDKPDDAAKVLQW